LLLFGNLNIPLFKELDVKDISGMLKNCNVVRALDKYNFGIAFLKIFFLSNFIFILMIIFFLESDVNRKIIFFYYI
jgi:hypothetical protein